ncbi:MAG: DUF302 domain-containing protein [Nitrososphaerota archaeon]|nr:DUF302 domain-containing protein [Nitrososphaerota archaeon]
MGVQVGYTVEAHGNVEDVVERLIKELSSQRFGILANIDVKKLIKEKLGQDMLGYVLLDVCNPLHAKKAIDSHKEVGLVLPCKILVYEDNGRTLISLYRPTEAIKLLGFSDLAPLADEVEKQLEQAIVSAK